MEHCLSLLNSKVKLKMQGPGSKCSIKEQILVLLGLVTDAIQPPAKPSHCATLATAQDWCNGIQSPIMGGSHICKWKHTTCTATLRLVPIHVASLHISFVKIILTWHAIYHDTWTPLKSSTLRAEKDEPFHPIVKSSFNNAFLLHYYSFPHSCSRSCHIWCSQYCALWCWDFCRKGQA